MLVNFIFLCVGCYVGSLFYVNGNIKRDALRNVIRMQKEKN